MTLLAEDPDQTLDPDDTARFSRPYTPVPRGMQPGAAWRVDEAAPELSRLCAGWALRGHSLPDLLGIVRSCECNPVVIPRVDLAARLAPGPLLDAMRAIPAQPDRLAAVEVRFDRWERRDPEYHEHHIRVPEVDVDDTRGLLERLSPERRELLERRMDEAPRPLSWSFVRDLFDHHTPDALFLDARLLELGSSIQLCKRKYASLEERRFLDAAAYEVRPGKMPCLVHPDRIWQRMSVAWIDLEELGLLPDEEPCSWVTHGRMGQVHSEGVRMKVYG